LEILNAKIRHPGALLDSKTLLARAPGSSALRRKQVDTHICTWAKTYMVTFLSSRTLQTAALVWPYHWLRPHASIVTSTKKVSKDFAAKNGFAVSA